MNFAIQPIKVLGDAIPFRCSLLFSFVFTRQWTTMAMPLVFRLFSL